ncbi:DUF4336 domain-containing protein [Coleofasciculus sp. E1-EBD-02]|uniref:DUF4336 domain-containing protein n=1 Tax=Coleofasciculus sp. E1-EBD-02 TaxID=3068481 RepID=UPI0032F5F5F0
MQEHQGHPSIHSQDWSWSLWFPVPLYPYGKRRTICVEVVKDRIWTFDQIQGILYVVVPIRMTVIKLDAGGLLIYAPVAPTPECIRLVQKLVAEHGEVKYIILPTVSGIEHKVFVGPFARKFPHAQVFVAPHQWSYPVNLPLSWLGFPRKRTHVLPADSRQTPFADEFDYAVLGPVNLGLGPFAEVGFWHKRSRTLLVTDTVVSVPENPPAIAQLDPYPLLFHARDHALDIVIDNKMTRRKGWQRICLFAFFFRPSTLDTIPFTQALREARKAPDWSKQAYFGLFPFQWKPGWQKSFDALRGNGRPFVAPILQTLILNRAPKETLNWVEKVASWEFERIIPCHLEGSIAANSEQFRQAFVFLEPDLKGSENGGNQDNYPLPDNDFELLRQIEATLKRRGILPPVSGSRATR